jgi:hypothetical protein
VKLFSQTTRARLRLSQNLLIAASDANKGLLMDPHWQKALANTTALLRKADNPNRKSRAVDEMNAADQKATELMKEANMNPEENDE